MSGKTTQHGRIDWRKLESLLPPAAQRNWPALLDKRLVQKVVALVGEPQLPDVRAQKREMSFETLWDSVTNLARRPFGPVAHDVDRLKRAAVDAMKQLDQLIAHNSNLKRDIDNLTQLVAGASSDGRARSAQADRALADARNQLAARIQRLEGVVGDSARTAAATTQRALSAQETQLRDLERRLAALERNVAATLNDVREQAQRATAEVAQQRRESAAALPKLVEATVRRVLKEFEHDDSALAMAIANSERFAETISQTIKP